MSNQVYSNTIAKYYDAPGLNVYGATLTSCPSLTDTKINFGANPLIVSFPSQISFAGDGTVTILEAGMYSIQYTISMTSDAPATIDIEASLSILLTRPAQFTDLVIARIEQRWVARGVAAGDPDGNRKAMLSYTGFFNVGDTFFPDVFNWNSGGSSGVTVGTTSNFIISKIY